MKKPKQLPIEEQPKKKKKKISKDADVQKPKGKKKKKKVKSKPSVPEPEVPKETEAERYARLEREAAERESREARANRQLQKMRHRDIQRECILRGMSFQDVVGFSVPKLIGWFTDHLDDGQDISRLNEYDAWIEKELTRNGTKDETGALLHPAFRFGVAGDIDDMEDRELRKSTKVPKVRGEKPKDDKPKVKRVKDETTGVMSGTKKSLTFELTRAGKKKDEIIEKVMEAFPDANEKSINIWIKRCKKAMKEEE